MRVSGSGRKQPLNTGNRKVSTSSLEARINQGHTNMSMNKTSNKKEVVPKINKTRLEEEKIQFKNNEVKVEEEKIIPKTEKKISKIEKSEGRKEKVKKSKKKEYSYEPIGKLTRKRVFGIVLSGMLSSVVVGGFGYGVYYNLVRYPSQMKEDIKSSGLGGIRRWEDSIKSLSNDTIKKETGEDSYLAKEIEYANEDENKIAFIKKMVSTVSYKPLQVEAKNIYGNPMISRVDDSIVFTDSLVNKEDEKVTLSYIDYTKVPLDEVKIKELVAENGLTLGIGDYSNGLVDIFCKYINSLPNDKIPLVEVKHLPNLVNMGDKYVMSGDEDVLLDKALFSSKEFYDLLDRFSEIASNGVENPDWVAWSKLSDEEKANNPEPSKTVEGLKTSDAWNEWNSKTAEEKAKLKEPSKYEASKVASKVWVGAYHLMNEYKHVDSNGNIVNKPLQAEVGKGTIENPASLNTGVVTSIYVNEGGARVAKPIKVKLIDYKVSQDALDYFESKDIRNRGYDIKSGVQYASYLFEVTNLSNEELTIYDNSSLSDELANLAPRTGTVYGLQNSVTLKPYESGIIESWGNSTELNKKYLIWGGDFNRELPVVWFRVLAGNIDDPSEDKGVTLNNIDKEE